MTAIMAGYEKCKVVFRRFQHTGSDESLSAPGGVAHHGYLHEEVTPEEGDFFWNRTVSEIETYSPALETHGLHVGAYGKLEKL